MIQHDTMAELAAAVYANAVSHGFWDEPREVGEMIALIVSELSEALDEHRKGRALEYKEAHSPFCSTAAWWSNWGEINFETSGDGTRFYKETIVGRMEIDPDNAPPCDSVLCKPEGVAVELADAYIRILDTLHPRGEFPDFHMEWDRPARFGTAIADIQFTLAQAYLASKLGHELTLKIELLKAARQIEELAVSVGCDDFGGVIRRKMAFNATRPVRHGKEY